MKRGLAVLLIAALMFGGTYWYNVARAVCDVPITYRIGTIDPRFKISTEEAKNAASEAESLWENATGKNLFTYNASGSVAINFVYDERQQNSDAAATLRDLLAQKENTSESVRAQYDRLLNEFNALELQYKTRLADYNAKLSAYNTEVTHWNEEGGAPKNVYSRLSATQVSLKREQETLNTNATSINSLATQINALGTKGNSIITDYNKTVTQYNDRFSEGHEFTQGDYTNLTIDIYEYTKHDELVLVLAHELGHALTLGHVDDPEAIMYHLMSKQSITTGVTQADLHEFSRVCGDGSLESRMVNIFRSSFFSPS